MKKETVALVILYNYDLSSVENIKSYAKQVDKVYAFDNTEDVNKNKHVETFLKKVPNLVYVNGCGNQGLSYAINKVGKMACNKGYRWMITFDQDSKADENMVERLMEFADEHDCIEKVGIISPIIKEKELKYSEPAYSYSYVDWVIQSGAMHNLDIFRKLRGYDNNIFIHQVDTEYCYRLMNNGYRIIRVNDAILLHNLSDEDVELKYLKGKKYYINKFSPMRYYYIIRNNLYCIRKYGKYNKLFCADLKRNTKMLLVTWILEKEKGKRAWAIIHGVTDFLLGNMGKSNRKF